MDPISINEDTTVVAAPDMVIITSTAACTEKGEELTFEVYLALWPDEAVKFANAILNAAANRPEEDLSHIPDDLFLEDGSLNPAYAK